ncbi:MAG: family 78 glycoside hydrolase catalytic domain [Clostridia bacterium]|nr:family 78 glycoside hydrolase catalytic domain [Clostridia bacterium]
MNFPTTFIGRGTALNTMEKYVPAPIFRKTFNLSKKAQSAKIIICGLGFYRLFINGTDITKGILAPYISNPDDIVYYDEYSIAKYLKKGKNAIGIMLGNGMLNADGGRVWDFDLASFRAAPMVSFSLDIDGQIISSDETVKTADSACYYDDLRCGCFYNANNEQIGWNTPDFDDSAWDNAIIRNAPKGKKQLCKAEPVTLCSNEPPISVKAGEIAPGFKLRDEGIRGGEFFESAPEKQGYIYDFGTNCAGIFTAKIKNAAAGTKISFQCAERLDSKGRLDYNNILFYPDGYAQRDIYICRGGKEQFMPLFTYHGFRYLFVSGIDPENITVTRHECTSALKKAGEFWCDNQIINKIQELTLRSDRSNFVYFPTDCPQREKNGWTGDAATSTEQFLYNFYAENSMAVWLDNIVAAQNEQGAFPGIIPTDTWGFEWGNGPSWDSVVQVMTDAVLRFSKNKNIINKTADALYKYIKYLNTQTDQNGLVKIGLGDWLQPNRNPDDPTTPVVVTNSTMCYQIAKISAQMFKTAGLLEYCDFASRFAEQMLSNIRKHLVSNDGTCALCKTQSAQAMFIYYKIFEEDKIPAAAKILTEFIKEDNNKISVGLVGIKTLFFALSDNGYADLALSLILGDAPSYAYLVKQGLTALPESLDYYNREQMGGVASFNHHYLGVVSAWFYGGLAGIKFTDDGVTVNPCIPTDLKRVKATCRGIGVEWKNNGNTVALKVKAPKGINGNIIAPKGYVFKDNRNEKPLVSGSYKLVKITQSV